MDKGYIVTVEVFVDSEDAKSLKRYLNKFGNNLSTEDAAGLVIENNLEENYHGYVVKNVRKVK